MCNTPVATNAYYLWFIINTNKIQFAHMIFPTTVAYDSHLSKRLSDLKRNGTQKGTPVSGIVFNTLSHGVVSFVASGSLKNHSLTG